VLEIGTTNPAAMIEGDSYHRMIVVLVSKKAKVEEADL
jgi:hypothetical protein